MTALVWRKEPPDKPGWWWMDWFPGLPQIVKVEDRNGRLVFAFPGTYKAHIRVTHPYAEWAGPIPLPKEAE